MYVYSIRNRSAFWDFCWKNFQIIHEGSYIRVVDESVRMDGVPEWFSGVKVNFAENLLFSNSAGDTTGKEDGKIAVTEVREGDTKTVIHLTWGQLRQKTGALTQAMKSRRRSG
jgi:acetoacetyl-CoA synthetase